MEKASTTSSWWGPLLFKLLLSLFSSSSSLSFIYPCLIIDLQRHGQRVSESTSHTYTFRKKSSSLFYFFLFFLQVWVAQPTKCTEYILIVVLIFYFYFSFASLLHKSLRESLTSLSLSFASSQYTFLFFIGTHIEKWTRKKKEFFLFEWGTHREFCLRSSLVLLFFFPPFFLAYTYQQNTTAAWKQASSKQKRNKACIKLEVVASKSIHSIKKWEIKTTTWSKIKKSIQHNNHYDDAGRSQAKKSTIFDLFSL